MDRHYGCFGRVEHRAKVYQHSSSTRALLAQARKALPHFDRVMKKLIGRIEGARYYGARVKGEARLKEKLDSWRTPEKIADYLGCRIIVNHQTALDQVLVTLGRRFDVVAHEDFLDGHAFKTGYRAIHTQLVGRNLMALGGDEYWRQRPCRYQWGEGKPHEEHEWPLYSLSVEVQVLPEGIEHVQHDYRWVYEKWRPYQMDHEAGKLDPAKAQQRDRDFGAMTAAYSRAAEQWNAGEAYKPEPPSQPSSQPSAPAAAARAPAAEAPAVHEDE